MLSLSFLCYTYKLKNRNRNRNVLIDCLCEISLYYMGNF